MVCTAFVCTACVFGYCLCVRVLQADGHCLYRSLEDQLEQTTAAADNSSSNEQQYNYQELRELAADYIREHK